MQPSNQISLLIPHKPLAPGGLIYCSEIAQGSTETMLAHGEIPPELSRAANLFSTRERFTIMQKALVSSDRRERELAVSMLQHYRDGIPALIESLQDNAWQVRAKATEGLAQHRVAESVEHLSILLKDRVATVRIFAAHALGEIGAPAKSSLDALYTTAFSDEVLAAVEEEDYFLLPFCNADLARLALERGADRRDNWEADTYQLYAIEAYEKIRGAPSEIREPLNQLKPPTPESELPAATQLFRQLMEQAATDAELSRALTNDLLIQVVRDSQTISSDQAASMLGTRGVAEAIPVLAAELNAKRPILVHHICAIRSILLQHSSVAMSDILCTGLLSCLMSDRFDNAAEAVDLLTSIDRPKAKELLIKAVVLGSDDVSEYAYDQLSRINFTSSEANAAINLINVLKKKPYPDGNATRIEDAMDFFSKLTD
jgi:hypothetical protein